MPQNVHALMENTNKMTTLVLLALTNVKLVKNLLPIVLHVTVSEITLQLVTVQITTSKILPTPVLNVTQNVPLVKITELTVLLVPPTEWIMLQTVTAQPVNMKVTNNVTIAHTNVLLVNKTLPTV